MRRDAILSLRTTNAIMVDFGRTIVPKELCLLRLVLAWLAPSPVRQLTACACLPWPARAYHVATTTMCFHNSRFAPRPPANSCEGCHWPGGSASPQNRGTAHPRTAVPMPPLLSEAYHVCAAEAGRRRLARHDRLSCALLNQVPTSDHPNRPCAWLQACDVTGERRDTHPLVGLRPWCTMGRLVGWPGHSSCAVAGGPRSGRLHCRGVAPALSIRRGLEVKHLTRNLCVSAPSLAGMRRLSR